MKPSASPRLVSAAAVLLLLVALAAGRKLYIANGPSADVSVVDVETGRVEGRITTGGNPWGVVVASVRRSRQDR